MPLVDSLLTAIVRSDGDALVLHVGEKPYVVAATGAVELSRQGLGLGAMEGLLAQLLSAEALRALREMGAVEHELPGSDAAEGDRFTVVAARGGDDIWIEIRRHRLVRRPVLETTVDFAAAVIEGPAAVPPSAPAPLPVEEPAPVPYVETPAPAEIVAEPVLVEPPAAAAHYDAPRYEPAPYEPAHYEPAHYQPAHYEPAHVEPAPAEPVLTEPVHAEVPPAAAAEVHEPAAAETPVPVEPIVAPMAAASPESAPETEVEHETEPDVVVVERVVVGEPIPLPTFAPFANGILEPHYEPAEPAPPAPPAVEPFVIPEHLHVEGMIDGPEAVMPAPEPDVAPAPNLAATAPAPEEPAPIVEAPPALEPAAAAAPVAPPAPAPAVPVPAPEPVVAAAAESATPPSAPTAELAPEPPAAVAPVAPAPVAPAAAAPVAPAPAAPAAPPAPAPPEPAPVVHAAPPAPVAPPAAPVVPPAPVPAPAAASAPLPQVAAAPEMPLPRRMEPAAPPRVQPRMEPPSPPASAPPPEPATFAGLPEPPPYAPALDAPAAAFGQEPQPTLPGLSTPPFGVDALESGRGEPTADTLPAVVLSLTRDSARGTSGSGRGGGVRPGGIERLLRLAAARGASALYLTTQARPAVRVDGDIRLLESEAALSSGDVEAAVLELSPEGARDRDRESAEWIRDLQDIGRVRITTFRDYRGPGALLRMISARATSAEQLGLVREIQALATEPEGLVIVTGPRASGKSTLVSAFVDLINRQRNDYVVTLEGQIRLVHESRGSLISQREVRGSAAEVVTAARAALRENPDVMVIEDLRSPDVLQVALDAAGSGLLVFASVTAASATAALERLVDLCPSEQRRTVRAALAEHLRGVVAQVLLRKAGGGRLAARELVLNTSAVAALIGDGQIAQLPRAIDSGRKLGMAPLNDALVAFVQSGAVDVREVYRKADDKSGLLALLRREGIDTSFVERLA